MLSHSERLITFIVQFMITTILNVEYALFLTRVHIYRNVEILRTKLTSLYECRYAFGNMILIMYLTLVMLFIISDIIIKVRYMFDDGDQCIIV